MVRKGGLEPPHLSVPDPKSGASANSATFAVFKSTLKGAKKNITGVYLRHNVGIDPEGHTIQGRNRLRRFVSALRIAFELRNSSSHAVGCLSLSQKVLPGFFFDQPRALQFEISPLDLAAID